jgi:thiol:disulfide interchange protein DsbD
VVRVGVRFLLEPHWHVYWKNPGDSGMTPSIRWRLPEGVKASEIAWPVPVRIPTPPFMTFGYEGEVTLSSEISVPAAYAASTLPVAADVEWLVCNPETCEPGDAKLSIEIPVRPGDAPRRPIAMGLPVPAGAVSARSRGDRVLLLAAAPGTPSFFFPAEPGVIEPSAEQHGAEQGGRKGLLLEPAKNRESPVRVLRGVLAFEDGTGWDVEVPVEPGEGSGSRLKWVAAAAAVVVAFVAHRMSAKRRERTS